MAVPIPVNLTMKPPPVGWKAQTPGLYNALMALVASSLSGSIDASFLTGQIGGAAPASNIGPWLNGNEWWTWDPVTSQYQPSQQGCPVGTIMMWGRNSSPPARWLPCNGASISRSTYSRLFNVIGTTWGSNGHLVFNLPPSNCFYFNAAGWYYSFDASVPITDPGWRDGVAMKGGSQHSPLLQPSNLPPLQIMVPYLNPEMIDQGGPNVPDFRSTANVYYYPVKDENGNVLGSNQLKVPIMPPMASLYYAIKYM